jgi:LPS sulfotransferase NodH
MKGDLERAYKIYREHLEYIQGQVVKRMVGKVNGVTLLRSEHKTQSISPTRAREAHTYHSLPDSTLGKKNEICKPVSR